MLAATSPPADSLSGIARSATPPSRRRLARRGYFRVSLSFRLSKNAPPAASFRRHVCLTRKPRQYRPAVDSFICFVARSAADRFEYWPLKVLLVAPPVAAFDGLPHISGARRVSH